MTDNNNNNNNSSQPPPQDAPSTPAGGGGVAEDAAKTPDTEELATLEAQTEAARLHYESLVDKYQGIKYEYEASSIAIQERQSKIASNTRSIQVGSLVLETFMLIHFPTKIQDLPYATMSIDEFRPIGQGIASKIGATDYESTKVIPTRTHILVASALQRLGFTHSTFHEQLQAFQGRPLQANDDFPKHLYRRQTCFLLGIRIPDDATVPDDDDDDDSSPDAKPLAKSKSSDDAPAPAAGLKSPPQTTGLN